MKNLTFEFRNLPKKLIESTGSYTLKKWAMNMERDIKSEIDYHTRPTFTLDDSLENPIVRLYIMVNESEVETLTCLLKNLHSAIVIN